MEETGAQPYPLSETGPDETLTPLNASQVISGEPSGPQYTTALQQQSQILASGAFSPPPFQLSTAQQQAIKAALAKLEESFAEEYAQGVPEATLEAQRQALQKRMMAEYAESYMKAQVAAYQAAKGQQEAALKESQGDLAAANGTKTAASSLMTQAQAAAGVAATNRQLMVTKQQELGALEKTVAQLSTQTAAAEEAKTKAEAARETAIQNATAAQAALAQAQQLNERLLEDVEDYTEARDALEAATAANNTAQQEKTAAVAAATQARAIYTQKQTARAAATARVTELEAEILTLNGLVNIAEKAAADVTVAAEALTAKEAALTAAAAAAAEAEAARVAAAGRVTALDADEALLAQLDTEKKALQDALSRAEAELVTSTQIVADAQAEMTRLSSLKTGVTADRARLDTDIESLAQLTGLIEQQRAALRAKRVEADAAICEARDAAGILANATTARDSAVARLQNFTTLRTSIMNLIGQIESTKSQIVAAVSLVAQREKELAAAAPLLPTADGIRKELEAARTAFTTAYQTFTTANDAYLTRRAAADTVRNTDTNRKFENLQVLQNLYHLSEDARAQVDIDTANRTFLSNCIVRYLSNAIHPNIMKYIIIGPGSGTNFGAITIPALADLDSRLAALTAYTTNTTGTLGQARTYFDYLIKNDYSAVSFAGIYAWLTNTANGYLTASANSLPHTWGRPTVTGEYPAFLNQPWGTTGNHMVLSLQERILEIPVVIEAVQQIRPAVVEWHRLNNKINSAANTGIEGTRDNIRQRAGERIREEIVNRPGLVTVTNHPAQGSVSSTTLILAGTTSIMCLVTRDTTRHPRASEPSYSLSVSGAIPAGQLPLRFWGLPNDLSGDFVRTELTNERTAFNARENPTVLNSLGTAGDTVYPILNRIADTFNQLIRNTQGAPPSVEKTTQNPPDWVRTQGKIVAPTLQLSLIRPAEGEIKGLPLFPANTARPLGINYSSWDLGYTPSPDPPSFIEWTADARLRTLNLYVRQLQKLKDYFGRIGLTHSPVFNGKIDAPKPTLQQRTDLVNRANQEINRMKTLPPPAVNDVWDRRVGQIPEIIPSGAGQPGRIVVATGTGTLIWAPPNTETEWKNYRRLVSRQRFHPPCFMTFKVESYAQGECHIGFSSAGTSTMFLTQSDGDYFLQIKPAQQLVRNYGHSSVPDAAAQVIGSTYLLIWTPTNYLLCYRNGELIGGDPGGLTNRPKSTTLNNFDFYYNGSYKQVMIQSTLNGGPVLTDVYFGQIPGYTMSEFDRLDRGLVTLDRINRRIRDDTIYQVSDKVNTMPMYATSATTTDMTTLEQATYLFIENASRHYRNVQNARIYRPILESAWNYLTTNMLPRINAKLKELNALKTAKEEEIKTLVDNDPDAAYRAFTNNALTTVQKSFSYNRNIWFTSNPTQYLGNETANLTWTDVIPQPFSFTGDTASVLQKKMTDLSSNIWRFRMVAGSTITTMTQAMISAYNTLKQSIGSTFSTNPTAPFQPTYTIPATDTTGRAAAQALHNLTSGNQVRYTATTGVVIFRDWFISATGVVIPTHRIARTPYCTEILRDWSRMGPCPANPTMACHLATDAGCKTPTANQHIHTINHISNDSNSTLTDRIEIFPVWYEKLKVLLARRLEYDAILARITTADGLLPELFNYVRLPFLINRFSWPTAAPNSFLSYLANNTPTGYTATSSTVPTISDIMANVRIKNFNTDANGYIAQNFTNPLNTSRTAVKRTNFRDDREAYLVFTELMREQINDIITDMNTYFGNYLSLNPLVTQPLYVKIEAPAVTTVPFTSHTMTNALNYINGLIQQYIAQQATAQTNLDNATGTLTQRTTTLGAQQKDLQALIGQVQTLYTAATGAFTFDGPESGPQFTANNLNLPTIFQQLTDTSTQATTLLTQATETNTAKQATAQTQIQAYRSLRTQLIAQLEAKDLKLRELLRDFATYLTSTSLTVNRTPVASGPYAEAATAQETGANATQAGGAIASPTLAQPSPIQLLPPNSSGPICSSGPNTLEPEATINYATLEGQLTTINNNINNYLSRLTAGITDLTNDLRLWNKIKRVQTAKKTTADTAYSAKAAAFDAQQKLIASTYQPTTAAVRQDLTAKTTASTQAAQQRTTAQTQRDAAATAKVAKDEASATATAARNAKLASVYQTYSSALQAAASGAEAAPTLDTITQIHDATITAREAATAAFQEAGTAKSAAEKTESAAITAANAAQTEKVEAQETYMTNLRELYLQYGSNVTLSVTGLQQLPELQLASGATPSPEIQGLELIQQADGASGSFGAFMLNTFLQRSQAYEQATQERTQANAAHTQATATFTSVQAAAAQAATAVQEKTQEIATTFNNQTLEQLTSIEQTAKTFAEQKVKSYEAAVAAVETLEQEIQQITQQIQQSEVAVTSATQLRVAAQAEVAAAEAAEEEAEEEVQEVYVERVEASRAVAEEIRLEESRALAETVRLEESRAVAEVKRIEESRAVAEVKRIEESRAAAESKAEAERLEASRAVAEVQRLNRESMAVATMIEENRVAEESRAVAAAQVQQARREALQKQLAALLGPTSEPGLPSGAMATNTALSQAQQQSGPLPVNLITTIATEIQDAVTQMISTQALLTAASVERIEAQGEVTRVAAELKLVQEAIMEAIRVGASTAVIQQLQTHEQQLLEELKEAQQTVLVATEAVEKLEAQLEQLATFIEERQEQQAAAQQEFSTATLATIAQKESQLKTLTQSIASTQATVQELTASKTSIQNELTEVQEQLATATGTQRTMLLATQARLQSELAEVQESVTVATESLVKLQTSAGALQSEIQALQQQLQIVQATEQQVAQSLGQQSGAIASAEAQRLLEIQATQQEVVAKTIQAEQSVTTMVESTGIAKQAEQIREQQVQAEKQLALALNTVNDTASQANILESGATQLSSVNVIAAEIQKLLTQLMDLQATYTKASLQQAEIQGEVERIQVELDSLRAATLEAIRVNAPPELVIQLQTREKELIAQLSQTQAQFATIQTTVNMIKEQITTVNTTLTAKQAEQITLENSVRSSTLTMIQQREAQLDTIKTTIEQTQVQVEALTTRISSLEKELSTVQQQLVNATGSQREILLTKQTSLQQELAKTQSSLTATTTALSRLQLSSTAIQSEIKILQQQITTITAARASITESLEKQITAVATQEKQRLAQLSAIQTQSLAKAEKAEREIQSIVRDSGVSQTAIRQAAQKRIEELNRKKLELISQARMQRAESRKYTISAMPSSTPAESISLSFKRALSTLKQKINAKNVNTMVPNLQNAVAANIPTPTEPTEESVEPQQSYGYGYGSGTSNAAGNTPVENTVMSGGGNTSRTLERLQARLESFRPVSLPTKQDSEQQEGRRYTRKVKNLHLN